MNAARKKKPTFKQTSYNPYNTGKVLIGSNYFPRKNYVCREGEKVQAALLGIESETSRRRVRGYILYMLMVFALFTIAASF
jgi:hypothetical protein